jgi:hypothetical protein
MEKNIGRAWNSSAKHPDWQTISSQFKVVIDKPMLGSFSLVLFWLVIEVAIVVVW